MAPTWSETVDTFFTSTWALRKKKAIEQAFLKTPFIYWLRQRGRIEFVKGYRRIEIPLEYGSNDTVRWFSKGDTIPITDSELLTMCYEEWKYVAASVIRWFQDDQQNRGNAQLINLANTKLGAAERSIWEELERAVFADGTGAKEPNGLQNLVADSPNTGTVHGLNRATYDWFRNQTKTASGVFGYYGLTDMRTCMNDIVKYSSAEMSDIVMVTDQTTFEAYEDECMEIKSLQNTMLADAGFETINFKGKPIMWCPSAPSAKMYFLNTNYIKLVCDDDYWMDMTSWKEIPDQANDRVAQIVCTMNMICSRPIVQKVLHTLTY